MLMVIWITIWPLWKFVLSPSAWNMMNVCGYLVAKEHQMTFQIANMGNTEVMSGLVGDLCPLSALV